MAALIRVERTRPGRVNFLFGVVSLLVLPFVSIGPLVEPLVRIWRPEYSEGIPLLQSMVVVAIYTLCCVLVLTYLDQGR